MLEAVVTEVWNPVYIQVKFLETVRIAPEGSVRVSNFLEKAADGLVAGGR